jgi:hypothetical protein
MNPPTKNSSKSLKLTNISLTRLPAKSTISMAMTACNNTKIPEVLVIAKLTTHLTSSHVSSVVAGTSAMRVDNGGALIWKSGSSSL